MRLSEDLHHSTLLKLPRLISDGMVLQRDAKVKIWGWAGASAKITLNFIGKSYHTTAGEDGQWSVMLPPLQAGGPYDMEIKADCRITIKNILVGDVWICSGQSNMTIPMARVKYRYADEVAQANNEAIRQFAVPEHYNFTQPEQDLLSGSWESFLPQNVLRFAAVGYFFAKALYEKYHVPIGLINASVGGTPVEAWMSEDALKAFPDHLETAIKFRDDYFRLQIERVDQAMNEEWYHRLDQQDQGLSPNGTTWFDPDFDASAWPTMKVPAYWDDQGLGPIHGAVWFRKEIRIPASPIGQPARLWLGRIVDSDSAYLNGTLVGTTSYQYPPRIYDIPDGLLKAGKNTIVVRVVNVRERGGFITDKPYHLTVGRETIDLKGEWQYKLGAIADPLPETTFIQYKPLGLFNGMIAPLLNYTMKGVTWYQGESNTERPFEYRELFSALITDWRRRWNQGDFPFLYVQLPNYMEPDREPSESNWAELREAQLKTLAVPNTGMAVAIDLGEWNDLHPLNKSEVGKRLALIAQKMAYGENNLIASGPVWESINIKDTKIIITFANTGSGLVAKGGGEPDRPGGFAIAGADDRFVWAKAQIEGAQVVVWSEEIQNPVTVRYAWANNPANANLYNQEGLPAVPFRAEL